MEYRPSRSQCQAYTAAPDNATPSRDRVNLIVVGTPSATPDAEPKLRVMSRRTTPSAVSASGPFEPSPGYGPAVSSGMRVVVDDVAPGTVVVDDDTVFLDEEHAANTASKPAPPSNRMACRRSMCSR